MLSKLYYFLANIQADNHLLYHLRLPAVVLFFHCRRCPENYVFVTLIDHMDKMPERYTQT